MDLTEQQCQTVGPHLQHIYPKAEPKHWCRGREHTKPATEAQIIVRNGSISSLRGMGSDIALPDGTYSIRALVEANEAHTMRAINRQLPPREQQVWVEHNGFYHLYGQGRTIRVPAPPASPTSWAVTPGPIVEVPEPPITKDTRALLGKLDDLRKNDLKNAETLRFAIAEIGEQNNDFGIALGDALAHMTKQITKAIKRQTHSLMGADNKDTE